MSVPSADMSGSALLQHPNPHTPHPTLDPKPQPPCPSHSFPLASLFPKRTHLRATYEPLTTHSRATPLSCLLPKALTYEPLTSLLWAAAGDGTSPHTLCLWTLLACGTEPPTTSNFTIVRRRTVLQKCAKRQPPHQVAHELLQCFITDCMDAPVLFLASSIPSAEVGPVLPYMLLICISRSLFLHATPIPLLSAT